MKKKLLQNLLSIIFWIFLWWFFAWRKNLYLLFPTPQKVFFTLLELLKTSHFYDTVFTSIGRILIGILAALVLGILLSVLSYKSSLFKAFLMPAITVVKSTPVASFIILCMLWIGASYVPILITILIVLPVVWTNLDVGFSKMDPNLIEVTKVYRFSLWKKTKLFVLPSLFPYFISACRTALGLAWKAGIAAEILTMPKTGIGSEIGIAKAYINTEEMFAWTLTVIIISLIIEFGFVKLMNMIPVFQRKKGG